MAIGVTPLPVRGAVFFDERDEGRTCRIAWHPAEGVFNLSIWRGASCLATFHLPQQELADFVHAFVTQVAGTGAATEPTGTG